MAVELQGRLPGVAGEPEVRQGGPVLPVLQGVPAAHAGDPLPVLRPQDEPPAAELKPPQADQGAARDIVAEMEAVYLADSRPWVIGYSGGKDSTCVVQLAWTMLAGLPAERRTSPIHVIASDTLVESPAVVSQITSSLDSMATAAASQGLPITTNLVRPITRDTFWACMIGRGYAAPTRNYRWCTSRLKIDNADRYIRSLVSEHGEVVMVLGQRKQESGVRRRVMESHEIDGSVLSTHGTLPNALVYTPIRDLDAGGVWDILLSSPSPWGGDNMELARLYRKANGGECPLVVDRSSPSCGNSRFGCWTCTVVDKDFSLENTIDGGEEWMRPLLELRNELKDTQRPERWPEVRDFRRATGMYQLRDRGVGVGRAPHHQLVPGPYTWDYRKGVLRALLAAQRRVRRDGPDPKMELITAAEVMEIQRMWNMRHGDWESSALEIYTGTPSGRGRELYAALRSLAGGEAAGRFLARLISIVALAASPREMRRELRYLANHDPRTDLGEVVRDLRAQRGARAMAIQTAMGDFA